MKNSQKYLKMNEPWLTKVLKKIVLLKDKLDHLFKDFGSNYNSSGKNCLMRLAKNEEKINNFFLK